MSNGMSGRCLSTAAGRKRGKVRVVGKEGDRDEVVDICTVYEIAIFMMYEHLQLNEEKNRKGHK
jgi:hypothetical protein